MGSDQKQAALGEELVTLRHVRDHLQEKTAEVRKKDRMMGKRGDTIWVLK